MFRLTLRNILANKGRFALTTFGVTMAISFVVAAFVLGDGLTRSFTDVSRDITAGIDLEVRGTAEFGDPPPLPASTASTVAAVDGVADAVPSVEGPENAVRPLTASGGSLPTDGPPQLAFNWIDDPELSAFTIVDGAPPQVGEFTMDVDSAAENGFAIGDTYAVMVPDGTVELTLSGTSSFGADNATLGAVLMQMNTAQAGELFGVDGISSVAVRLDPGADPAAVQAAVASAVPTAEVVDHATVLEETTTEFTDEIDVVRDILLGFGGVAVLVSMFIIFNTFAIVVGQRTRELALLRTVGAGPDQVRRSVVGEALLVGALAAAAGIGGGIVVAKGIDALFGVMGVDLIDYPLIISVRTVVTAVVLALGVTTLASIGPARRAARVRPLSLLAGDDDAAGGSRRRAVAGTVLVAAGVAAGWAGLAASGSAMVTVVGLAVGAVALFVGVTLLSPMAVGALTGLLGWPMRRIAGVAGRLAQQNASRNSRRTATTAAALMIGLAVVTTAFVVGQSVKATVGSTFERASKADYYMTDELDDVDFPAALVTDLEEDDTVAAATGFTRFRSRVDGAVIDVVGFDFDQIDALLDLDVRAGAFTDTVVDPVVVSSDRAASAGSGIGDRLEMELADGARVEGTIVGIFDDQSVISEDVLVDTSVLRNASVAPSPEWVAFSLADGASGAAVDGLVARLADDYPYAAVETPAEFQRRIEGMVDAVLTMVNAMVALAVLIALIGIANTLALSVLERTRELGLVRAVGMSRRQVRRMVRLEAALVALFGAVVGVALGLLFGSAVVSALDPSVAASTAVPVIPIVGVVAVAALAAVVAAWLPARRAGRLDVLEAIAF